MGFNHIKIFLEKFKTIIFSKEETLSIISNIIKKHTFIFININLIKIKNTTIYIKSSPIVKNEILLHKKEILFDLQKLILKQSILDIK